MATPPKKTTNSLKSSIVSDDDEDETLTPDTEAETATADTATLAGASIVEESAVSAAAEYKDTDPMAKVRIQVNRVLEGSPVIGHFKFLDYGITSLQPSKVYTLPLYVAQTLVERGWAFYVA